MGKNNIEKFSLGYALVKAVTGFWHNNFFYRKIIVLGLENINPGDHLIFAPNHQNALMDALAVLFTHKGQPVFLARADIFKKKLIASILYFLKILPVYRIRDGFSSLKGNDEIFLKTIDVIRNKSGLVILPEGDHAGFRRLRQLKKGICRVAFQSEEATNFSLNIKIIPIGIEFSDYIKFREVLTVAYGKPIEVSEYYDIYRDSPEKALNELRERISREIKKMMINIESQEDYEAINELRNIVNNRFTDDSRQPRLQKDKLLIENINKLKESGSSTYEKICILAVDVKRRSGELKTGYANLDSRLSLFMMAAGVAGLIITLPVFLYGAIFNLIFAGIPTMQSRKIKDPQFRSSISYGISAAMAILLTPLILILSLVLIKPLWLGLLIFFSFSVAALFSWRWSELYSKLMESFRIRMYRRKHNIEFSILRRNHKKLLNLVDSIMDEK